MDSKPLHDRADGGHNYRCRCGGWVMHWGCSRLTQKPSHVQLLSPQPGDVWHHRDLLGEVSATVLRVGDESLAYEWRTKNGSGSSRSITIDISIDGWLRMVKLGISYGDNFTPGPSPEDIYPHPSEIATWLK